MARKRSGGPSRSTLDGPSTGTSGPPGPGPGAGDARTDRAVAGRPASRVRARARLREAQEREEALASAAQEHEENEELLAAIRDLLRLAPARVRDRSAWLPGLDRRPFPAAQREAADRERLESEVRGRLAEARVPRAPARVAAVYLSPLVAAGGAALAFWTIPAGVCLSLAGLFFWLDTILRCRRERAAFLVAEEARVREEVGARLAAERDRDRGDHDREEDERLAGLRALVSGDSETCVRSFREACASLDLPVDATAELSMRRAEAASVEISLHPEDAVPVQRSTLLKTGRISYRNRPRREVREDDARAIASLCLLYGAVAFDRLPSVERAIVSASRRGTDPATGADSAFCLASAVLTREGFGRLRLDRLDPVAALRSFPARFSCTASFIIRPVEPFSDADVGAPASDAGTGPRRPSDRGTELEAAGSTPVPPPARRRRASAASGARSAATPASETAADAESLAGSAAGAPVPVGAPAGSGPAPSPLDVAQHVLALAMACGRADGAMDRKELDAVTRLIEARFQLSPPELKRLNLRRESLLEGEVSIDAPARTLRAILAPRERQLLVEQLLEVIASDGRLHEAEARLFRGVAGALDVSEAVVEEMLDRSGGGGRGEAGDPAVRRARWLGALDLPPDAALDRQTLDRAGRRMEDLYAEERFRLLAPELREMAARRVELVREALRGLAEELPEEAPVAAPEDAAAVRRENPDLDSIFG